MNPSLASMITKAASMQSYYTIRLLADRARMEDAFRAYAYFRWVDDILDTDSISGPVPNENETRERIVFLERQKLLLEKCIRQEMPKEVNPQEEMLVELVQSDGSPNSGLRDYLRNMMLVMDFDVRRRGRTITQYELNMYTHRLAIAVTENLHYFIGHGDFAPLDETRYLAVCAAHIAHMLRDTYVDSKLGYYNIQREVLKAHQITIEDKESAAYRSWVQERVALARRYFKAGRSYFRRVENLRHRLAGFAYMARFEWVLDTIENDDFVLRRDYKERKSKKTALEMGWSTILSMINFREEKVASATVVTQHNKNV